MAKDTPTNNSTEQPEPDASPKERVILDRLAAKGIEVDAEDDDSLLSSFEQLLADKESAPPRDDYERLKKLEPYATEYTQHAADFQRWKAEQAKAAQAKDEPEPELPTPPKVDQAAAQVVQAGLGTGKVTRTSQGLYETADPAYMPFVQVVNKTTMERRDFFQKFEDNPADFIGTYTKSTISKLEKKHSEEVAELKKEMAEFRKGRNKDSIDQFFQQNYQEFWQTTEDGKVATDASGKMLLNLRGQAYVKAMTDLADVVEDENKRHEKAVLLARHIPLPDPDEEPADRKKGFLRRNAKKPARTTDRSVEHSPKGKDVTAGVTTRRMDWDELMRQTQAEIQ